jgi:hypothetical protein
MKTTIDLPDDLLIEVKKHAAERRTTIRALVERGLRRELSDSEPRTAAGQPLIRWITVEGGLPQGLDVADRARMMDWLHDDRP